MPDQTPNLDAAALRRYSRQILLEEVGVARQQKLAAAKVLIVGAGGLGSPAALYLTAAGVGTLGIADLDIVEEHNLQRQLLHTTDSVGQAKVESAAATLRALNPLVKIVPHPKGITAENAVELFTHYDVIVDGTDNFAVRYLNNDAAYFAQKPLVHGSVFKFEGQVSVFDPASGGPCYRCLFPAPPAAGSVPGCGESGVIGALCGIIGSMQAMEVIKLITGCGETLRGRLLTYDALSHQVQTIAMARNPTCPLCSQHATITGITPTRYAPTCENVNPTLMNHSEHPLEISVTEAHALLQNAADDTVVLIDVREPFEVELCRVEIARHIPMRQVPEQLDELSKDHHLLIMCHHGGRSQRVAEFLRAQGYPAVTNVAGGIDAWAVEIDSTLTRY
uniref:HesA/MoeB/ThiF family protein n=1 Tax=Cephaloticoccus sp. TaxID=1985742 RepID=UPI00404AD715